MIAVIQRVKNASVTADGVPVGAVGHGLFILLGVLSGDSREDAELLSAKIGKLRIFSDAEGKMNLSVADIEGGALVVSNFTLAANYAHGNRPDFLAAEKPEAANALYEYFTECLGKTVPVETGVFGADMQISMTADGPVTIVMDSGKLQRRKDA